MESNLITCNTHGQGPAYVVCLHVVNGTRAHLISIATECEIGHGLCEECCERAPSLGLDDLTTICAGCFVDLI